MPREGDIDGRGLFLMHIPPGSVPIAMVGEKSPHVSERSFEIMDEAARAIELDKLLPILRIDLLDHAHFTLRNAVIPRPSNLARAI